MKMFSAGLDYPAGYVTMPIDVAIREATDLPDKYVNLAVSYIQFLQFRYEQVPVSEREMVYPVSGLEKIKTMIAADKILCYSIRMDRGTVFALL